MDEEHPDGLLGGVQEPAGQTGRQTAGSFSHPPTPRSGLTLAESSYQILQGRRSCLGSLKRFTVEERGEQHEDRCTLPHITHVTTTGGADVVLFVLALAYDFPLVSFSKSTVKIRELAVHKRWRQTRGQKHSAECANSRCRGGRDRLLSVSHQLKVCLFKSL